MREGESRVFSMTRKFIYSPAILMQLCASSGACCLFGVSRPSAHIADIVYVHFFLPVSIDFSACMLFILQLLATHCVKRNRKPGNVV